MTFGAVATGSMNAHEALMAAGIMNSLGSMAAPMAPAARMGISSVVVAVLLVVSVRKVTVRQMTTMITAMGRTDRPVSRPPMVSLKPDDMNAVAIEMPAPKSMSMPQGIS